MLLSLLLLLLLLLLPLLPLRSLRSLPLLTPSGVVLAPLALDLLDVDALLPLLTPSGVVAPLVLGLDEEDLLDVAGEFLKPCSKPRSKSPMVRSKGGSSALFLKNCRRS